MFLSFSKEKKNKQTGLPSLYSVKLSFSYVEHFSRVHNVHLLKVFLYYEMLRHVKM